MGEGDKPNRAQQLADALEQARQRDSQKARPHASSEPPPPRSRHSMPHREKPSAGPRESLSGEVRQASSRASEPPPRVYGAEVRRASLLSDDEEDNFDPRAHFNLMMPAAAPAPEGMRGATLKPGVSERRSSEPLGPSIPAAPRRPSRPMATESTPAAPKRSLGRLAALRSLLPGAPRNDKHEEDPRFQHALNLCEQNRKLEALTTLEELRRFSPGYPKVRETLFEVALELGVEERIQPHADWVLQQQSQEQEHEDVCANYRNVRRACPNLGLVEKTLVAVLIASEKIRDGRVTLDATKLLLRDFPESSALPRAFMSSAHVQIAEGRTDLGRATLENLIARFPYDSLAGLARQKLNEIW